ncbi:MAG: nucleotidyltransferase domain-containing protein [Oscillospiraceae bacterium]|jgi:predicted nucleotidyltransferase|nr:nucleotidyltransferase domain-containing protein [Oscillospiraceae bacterium]
MRPYETPEIQEKLKIITESVLRAVPDTEAIYLFGSYAYGEPHKDSDLDICVIVPDSATEHKRPIEIAIDVDRFMPSRFGFPTDLIVKRASVFENRRTRQTLDKVIATKGVKIYG